MLRCAFLPYAKREPAAQDPGFVNSLGYDVAGVVLLPALNFLLWASKCLIMVFTFSTLVIVDQVIASGVAAVLVSTLVSFRRAVSKAPFLRTRNNVGVVFLRDDYEAG